MITFMKVLSKLIPSEFAKQVFTLLSATTVAQVIPIALMPFLSRLYTPEELGHFALYQALAIFLAVCASGRFELAIVLPKERNDALQLMFMTFGLVTIVSLILLLIAFLFGSQLSILLESTAFKPFLYILPASV